jgi:hypothetical protein
MVDESAIRERWLVVERALDEHGRRWWTAAEASSHGQLRTLMGVFCVGALLLVVEVLAWVVAPMVQR